MKSRKRTKKTTSDLNSSMVSQGEHSIQQKKGQDLFYLGSIFFVLIVAINIAIAYFYYEEYLRSLTF